jgi:hypothetical protein
MKIGGGEREQECSVGRLEESRRGWHNLLDPLYFLLFVVHGHKRLQTLVLAVNSQNNK